MKAADLNTKETKMPKMPEEHDDDRTQWRAAEESELPVARYDNPRTTYDNAVYVDDVRADGQSAAAVPESRMPGFRCDNPVSRCDTVGHELEE